MKEIYKFPYNGRVEDETEIFLSDLICQCVLKINSRNSEFFYVIRHKINSKKTKILVTTTNKIKNSKNKIIVKKKEIFVGTAILVSWWLFPRNTHAMGLPVRSPSMCVIELNRTVKVDVYQYAPTVSPREDKVFMNNNNIIPLIYMNYMNGHYSYINEKLLKKLRAGDLSSTVAVAFITLFVLLIAQSGGVEAFASFLNRVNGIPSTSHPANPSTIPTLSTSHTRVRQAQMGTSTALQAYGPSQTQISTFMDVNENIDLDKAYQEVQRRARFSPNFNCSRARFDELVVECGRITSDSVRGTITGLQLEADGVIKNLRRDPIAQAMGFFGADFLADGPDGTTHLEIKGPVGQQIKLANDQRPSIAKQAKKIAKKITYQTNLWTNDNSTAAGQITPVPNQDPKKILVVTDLFDVPNPEKAVMQQAITSHLTGQENTIFINNITNR